MKNKFLINEENIKKVLSKNKYYDSLDIKKAVAWLKNKEKNIHIKSDDGQFYHFVSKDGIYFSVYKSR